MLTFALVVSVVYVIVVAVLLSLFHNGDDEYTEVTASLPILFSNPPVGRFIAQTWLQNGEWAEVFGPGWHFVFLLLLYARVERKKLTTIPEGKIGIVVARDGAPLEDGQVIAEVEEPGSTSQWGRFSNGPKFLQDGGQKGPQKGYLGPGGTYVINRSLFDVTFSELTTVKEGDVAVLISSVGGEPLKNELYDIGKTINPDMESLWILSEGVERRGVLHRTLGPGQHAINKFAYQAVIVDTTTRKVSLDGKSQTKMGENTRVLDAVVATTNTGHTVLLKAELVMRVPRKNASAVVVLARSVDELVLDVVMPFLDDSAKRVISERTLGELVQRREAVRREIEKTVTDALEKKFPVDVISFRVIEIDFEGSPDKKVREYVDIAAGVANAEAEQLLVTAQTKVARKRIELQQANAEASNQETLVRARFHKAAAPDVRDGIKEILEGFGSLSSNGAIAQAFALALAHPNIPGLLSSISASLTKSNKEGEGT